MDSQNGHPMEERLTIEEIYRRHPDEWVLLDGIETDRLQCVLAGRVIAHSKDRDEVYQALLKVDAKEVAIRYTGKIADDVAVVL